MKKKLVIYVHGKGGSFAEADHYKPLLPDFDVVGFDYKSETPWDAKKEFRVYFESVAKSYDEVLVIANSIGAFFTMMSLGDGLVFLKRNYGRRKRLLQILVKPFPGNT